MYSGLHVKCCVLLSDVNGNWIFTTECRKTIEYKISQHCVQWHPSSSMRSESEAVRGRGMTKLIVGFQNFANATEHYKFFYSREFSKYVTSTGKSKGTNMKISVIFETS